MLKLKLLHMVLNLFEGGAAAGASGAAAAPGSAPEGGTQGDNSSNPGNTHRGRSGAYDNVVFGKAPEDDQSTKAPAAGEKKEPENKPAPSREERRKAYDAFIKGEGKEFYTEDTQNMINRRFKDVKGMQTTIGQYQPIIDQLLQRYGVSDVSKLQEAIDNDSAYLEDAADAAGMTVDAYKGYMQAQRENAQLKAFKDQAQSRERAEETLRQWYQDAETVKETYPDFNLEAEVENPKFLSLLKAHVPMMQAYQVMHMDEINAAAADAAAAARERQVTESIRKNGSRPAENGTSSRAGFVRKDDVNKLSREDRREIALRARRGELIRF